MSECQSYTANQISSDYLNPRLRYNYFRFGITNVRHFTPSFDFDYITAVQMSFCISLQNYIQIGSPSAEKNDAMSIFKMADLSLLDFRGPIMGSLKSARTTSYRSSIETIALNCLVFENIAFLKFGDRQTNKQRNKQTDEQMDTPVA